MINWSEGSTIRGLAWLAFGIIGAVGWWFGKDLSSLAPFAAVVTGGLGVLTSDK